MKDEMIKVNSPLVVEVPIENLFQRCLIAREQGKSHITLSFTGMGVKVCV